MRAKDIDVPGGGARFAEGELDWLADEVRRHHKAVGRHARSMLDEAIAAGEALIEAKRRLRHGEFGPWLAYCGVSRRSASLYMKLAREKGNVAVLEASSIREALEALGGKRKRRNEPSPDFGKPGLKLPDRGGWQVVAWREAMAAEGRRELFAYYVPDGQGVRLCWTTVEDAAYCRSAAP
jgi:Protein of unknown function (DUF3102)